MSATRRNSEPSIDQTQFFEVYATCSQLIAEIGREFIKTWKVDEAANFQKLLVDRLVEYGCARTKAETAWRLLIEGKETPDSEMIGMIRAMREESNGSYFCSTNRITPHISAPLVDENVFCFEGGRWVVRFHGQTIYPQDITGIKYLHCLISNAGQSFSPQELYEGFGCKKRSKAPNSLSAGEAFNSGVGFSSARPDVVIDQRGKAEMLARLEDIETEMKNAKLVPDADLIEKLATERIAIKEELRKAFTPVGSRKMQDSDLVRRMKAVDIAIRRAKEKILDSGHSALLTHLNETVEVKVRSGCRYSTPEAIAWRTDAVQ